MVIKYRLGSDSEERKVIIDAFPHFFEWLWNMGAGVDRCDAELLERWTDLFRRIMHPDYRPETVSLARARIPGILTITGKDSE